MTPKAELEAIAKELAKVKEGSKKWKQLQRRIDVLCGMDDTPRDVDAEAEWERKNRED